MSRRRTPRLLGPLAAVLLLAAAAAGPGAAPAAAPAGAPADDGDGGGAPDGIATLAEPQRCEDGHYPEESLRPARAEGAAVRRIREAGRLVVGIDQNSYLWGYRTPDGSLAGFDIDLVQAIATDLLGPDPEIVYRAIPTGQRIDALRERDVDLVVRTMSITCRRLAEIAFSTAYFETGQQLVVPGDSPIRAYDDTLAGRRVCSADGSTARTWLEHDPRGAELVPAANHLDCLVLLQLGEVDALMTDGALAAGHLAQDPSLRLAGEPLTTESYGVAVNIADTDLVRWVNAVLDDYRAGGTGSDWRRAYDAWLAPYLTTRTDDDASPAAPAPPQPLYRD